jgi:hypothetical protein
MRDDPKASDYRKIIDENDGWDTLHDFLCDEGDEEAAKKFTEITGLGIKFIDDERTVGDGDFNGYIWRFHLSMEKEMPRWRLQTFQAEGWYDSHQGRELDSLNDFYEVKAQRHVVTIYERVQENETS